MTEDQLFTAWHREFEIQNRELKDAGEEPLTAAEFFGCRAEDALSSRIDAERLRVERWHATYNAALTGILSGDMGLSGQYALGLCRAHADALHGKLKP